MAKYWIKLWTELLKDDKVGILDDTLWRRMVECFLMAGLVDDNGRLPAFDRMAWITHQPPEILEKELETLQNLGIIEQKEGGAYHVTKWAKRQRRASPAERKRAQRERERAESHNDVTKDVTSLSRKRDQEEQRNRSNTTTTAAGSLGDYVVNFLSPNGQVSSATAELVKSLLGDHSEADIIYAVGQAERKAATTNDPPTLEYIEAICKRRKSGEPDRPATKKRGTKNGAKQEREADPTDPDEWDRMLKA